MSQWQKRYGGGRPDPFRKTRPPVKRNAPVAKKAKGPTQLAPKVPASGKQRKRMLHAAAWRLARLVRKAPAEIHKADLTATIAAAIASHTLKHSRAAEARRLAAKVLRLRQRTATRK